MKEFSYFPVELVKPDFDDPLTDLIIDLDHQRQFAFSGTTPIYMFKQIKELFHILESLGSARIEGNRTTIAERVDREAENSPPDTNIREILNIEEALDFLEAHMSSGDFTLRIDERLIRELHLRVTIGMPANREGDSTPGEYRSTDIRIARSPHSPPPPEDVGPLMKEMIDFLNNEDPPKYDLIKIALAHHRFVWIHPFSNGNGRTVRLMTYALLLKAGFRVGGDNATSRILNPTAVFCCDRDQYYDNLALADTGSRDGLLTWIRYVLEGLKHELEKVEKLMDYTFLKTDIILPAINELHRKNGISDYEKSILQTTVEKGTIQNRDIRPVVGDLSQVQVSRILAEMKKNKLLVPSVESERKYVIGLSHSSLMREIFRQLDRHEFLPMKGEV